MIHTSKQTNAMKNYGNGIFASDDRLAAIGLKCMEQERQQAQARAAARREWFEKWEDTRPRGQFGTWNISDRD